MKLIDVSVEGCGRFGTLTRIEGLGPGVNILSARNEAGKSTLFRAIRTCLFERHSSASRDIAALATEGLSLPVTITVRFEKGGKTYAISKSFLKSKAASLVCDGTELARNAEADERVWELLGIAPRSTRALDDAAFGILWVAQGQSFHIPEPSEGATSVLNQVIQQEVGTLVGGERARSLLSTLKDDLSKLVTDTRKPRANGQLDLAQKENERLTAERFEVEGRLKELNDKLESLAQLRADHKRQSDPAAAETMKRELAEAQEKLASAEKLAQALLQLQGEERHAHERLTAQRERLDSYRKRADAIDDHRKRLKALGTDLPQLDEQETSARKALGEAMARKAEFDREADTLDAREQDVSRLSTLSERVSKRDAMAERINVLEGLRTRSARNEADLKAATVDEAALASLVALEQEEASLRAAMEAAAARLTIEAKPGAQVSLNGAEVHGNAARGVTEPLTIAVGDAVSISITPPAGSLAVAEKKLKDQREKLSSLLAHHGAKSPQDFRQMRSARIVLEEQFRELRAERNALGIKDSAAAEIARLEAEVQAIDAGTRQVLATTGRAELPPAAELSSEKQAITERRAELRAARAGCESVIAGQNEILERVAQQRGVLQGQMREIHAKLESDLALLPDAEREQIISTCAREVEEREVQHRSKAALLAERRAEAPDADEVERLKGRAARYGEAIQNRANAIDQLNQKIARLEGEIQTAGGDGLGERADTLKLQQAMALKEFERQTERVEVMSLLRNTVEACYAKRREELNAPLRRHLKPFLNDVFPQAEIELGENFAVAGLSRSGPAAELFGRLSLGTQEQIAVLVRLAMGAMICEKGADVPIILDDALVFSDDDRIEQMFDAINRAGRNQQVIVLTCRSRSFTSLGGRQLQIV